MRSSNRYEWVHEVNEGIEVHGNHNLFPVLKKHESPFAQYLRKSARPLTTFFSKLRETWRRKNQLEKTDLPRRKTGGYYKARSYLLKLTDITFMLFILLFRINKLHLVAVYSLILKRKISAKNVNILALLGPTIYNR